jgi:glycosyltransferase involved in cell wall biosynthesis
MSENTKPTIGLAMVTLNEQVHIPSAIAQFYHVVNDIVVCDGGSSDESVHWAERMGARVVHRPWDNDFSAQKNFAISQLETDWIYLHDPDERLEPTLLEMLPHLVCEQGQLFLKNAGVLPGHDEIFDCFGIARKNFIDGIQTEIYPDYQYRLFRNYCRFEGTVHEKITNFKNRTEIDYTRPDAARPVMKREHEDVTIDTERGQIETGVNVFDVAQISRFNILHYKSSKKQQEQDEKYRMIKGES